MTDLVVKSNALVESSHKLNEVEQRLILLAVLKARELCDTVENLKGKQVELHASDYANVYNTTRQGAYKAIRTAVISLYRQEWGYKYINKNGNTTVAYERFTQSAKYVEAEAVVKFVFADAIIPHLVELERNFTAYEIAQVAKLTSRYAMRLYECLKQYKSTGTLKISLDELRFRFGLLPDEYVRMSDFKKGVLNLSVKEINEHTDLTVSYEQQKRGRIITGFVFDFKQKSKRKKPKENEQQRDPNTPDMLAPIKMTDAQRKMFAGKLAHLPELGSYAPQGADYSQYAEHIANNLLDPTKAEFYRPFLEQVGYKQEARQ